MVVAAGMPVLALTLLWGGVAIEFILVGYVATFLCIFSSGAIAASVAGSSETLREAVLKSYAYILVFDVSSSRPHRTCSSRWPATRRPWGWCAESCSCRCR